MSNKQKRSRLVLVLSGLVGIGAAPMASAQSWTMAPPIPTPVSGHSSTVLADGRVLLAGGYNNGAHPSVASPMSVRAQLYNPATNTFSATGNMVRRRLGHSATLLPNGKVLVAGGYYVTGDGINTPLTFNFLTAAELYDPATGRFTATGSMVSSPRAGHTATLLADGRVLVTGGESAWFFRVRRGAWTATAEIYDPATGAWTAAGSMSYAISGHSASLLPDGRVLVAGGYVYGQGYQARTEIFDPATRSFAVAAPMSVTRVGHFAVTLPNGEILVGNGAAVGPATSAEIYTEATDTWRAAAAVPSGIGGPAVRLDDGRVLAVSTTNVPGMAAALYDAATDSWSAAPAPVAYRSGLYTLSALPGGRAFLAGGDGYYYDAGGALTFSNARAELFGP